MFTDTLRLRKSRTKSRVKAGGISLTGIFFIFSYFRPKCYLFFLYSWVFGEKPRAPDRKKRPKSFALSLSLSLSEKACPRSFVSQPLATQDGFCWMELMHTFPERDAIQRKKAKSRRKNSLRNCALNLGRGVLVVGDRRKGARSKRTQAVVDKTIR